jgi:pimeloyl-ACP methyl ester carboxylesterase
MRTRFWLGIAFITLLVGPLSAQQYAPPAAKPPDEATLKAIAAKTEKLERAILTLRKLGVRDPALADIEIFHKAAVWIVRHGEFYQANFGDWTLAVLDRGLLRASQMAQGELPWLNVRGQEVVRGYRSRVDGSVQPYAVALPADYATNPQKKYRIDVVLHGRDSSICEAKFLYQHGDGKNTPKDQDFIRIDIFGRGNNAYRWAGEADVFEAMDNFITVERLSNRAVLLDPSRFVLRGFSMGGAGTWHLGLHHPDRWCVIGPGAGFTTTHGYIGNLPAKLPYYQESCLRIYDAVDYAENAFDVPIVAYSGSEDAQKAAADNIEKRLKTLGLPMTHIVAPGLAHSFPAEWQKKAEAEYAKHAGPGKGRAEYPPKVQFTTYTLKYPSCAWVEMIGLEKHYEKSVVDAEKTEKGFTVKTQNVHSLRLALPEPTELDQPVKIDGQEVSARPSRSGATVSVYLEKVDGRWQGVLPQRLLVEQMRRPRKSASFQGPIDDAFMGSFLCVRGTGKAWHEKTEQYAEQNLKRFAGEWNKFMRGDLPIKDDVNVTEDDIATKHLVLFGDPSSNSLIAQVLDGIPLRWTKENITMAGKTYSASEHVPVMIYPSPLNTGRYVVLNSGHTFRAADFQGTNALLYPRLGDYAILKPTADAKQPATAEVVTAGLFDDLWQFRKE